ncbi:MAG: hypothetical protein AVDCRST_MAG48-3426 [uncultured Friedmanniella sp.]|uniref:Uncharacterized protein n=1 Tax=uncultured Friedmanniella sp. TaxID=335381 RepID=A0A6J4LLL1_9ACTN|nr:MAG: hypothetical protein AVDCRST_MAG48-3426 [uncultured Friedmanniella sp.]
MGRVDSRWVVSSSVRGSGLADGRVVEQKTAPPGMRGTGSSLQELTTMVWISAIDSGSTDQRLRSE